MSIKKKDHRLTLTCLGIKESVCVVSVWGGPGIVIYLLRCVKLSVSHDWLQFRFFGSRLDSKRILNSAPSIENQDLLQSAMRLER